MLYVVSLIGMAHICSSGLKQIVPNRDTTKGLPVVAFEAFLLVQCCLLLSNIVVCICVINLVMLL